KKLSYSILNKPTIGRIERKVKAYNKINNNTTQNQPLFILDYASEELAQYFRRKNLFFIDAVGNCFINLPNLKIAVEGKKHIVEVSPNRRAFQKTGLKLIFQILQSPDLVSLNYREIAQQTGISLASVGYVLDELKEDGFLIAAEKQKRRLSNVKRLVYKWSNAYAENLRPKIHRGNFIFLAKDSTLSALITSIRDNNIYVGGEFGASLLNHSIKPEKLILYTNNRLSQLAQKHQIVPKGKLNTSTHQIEIFEKFWQKKTSLKQDHLHLVTAPILIYADLMLSNKVRNIETAEAILNNEIRHRFLKDNLQW
ncbi:MAG: type IV toxin-antitoxin system AbiEi family antitoxin, partial [Bacteroidota bacterium]